MHWSGLMVHRHPEDAQSDLEALLDRMRRRRYPESIPVLATYWLKTVYAAGHKRAWWRRLNELLKRSMHDQGLNEASRQALGEIQAWIEQAVIRSGKTPAPPAAHDETFRANLGRERAATYISRLLNEWLSLEISRLLVSETMPVPLPDVGIPALAVGMALEQLLLRERFTPETLEMLLESGPLSPHDVYPADVEVLRDVLLYLLGRVWAPPVPAMPATLLTAEWPLPADYGDLVGSAKLVAGQESDEIQVPISAEQAQAILKHETVHMASVLVTMDGRWWQSENLQSGEKYTVVYRPGGRLRIDYSADHARLDVPWTDTQLRWSGGVHFGMPFEIFGREWRASSWETDGERTWLHLMFSRTLPVAEVQPAEERPFRRSRPAVVDMAWAALENAVAESIEHKSREPIEQLRRPDMIPLGRAIFGLTESVMNRWLPKREAVEMQLKAIRYLEAEGTAQYGRVPWRVLPLPVQKALLKKRSDTALVDLLLSAFDGLPEILSEPSRHPHGTTPSQAA